MKQIVANKKLSNLGGLLLILGLMAALMLLNWLVNGLLYPYIGNLAATIIFWGCGALIAWLLLRLFVVQYSYELGSDVLRLNRSYGKRDRHIEDIYLSRVMFVGDPAEAKTRYPGAKKLKAVHAKVKTPVTAVVYKASNGVCMALIQANDELKQKLEAICKQK